MLQEFFNKELVVKFAEKFADVCLVTQDDCVCVCVCAHLRTHHINICISHAHIHHTLHVITAVHIHVYMRSQQSRGLMAWKAGGVTCK